MIKINIEIGSNDKHSSENNENLKSTPKNDKKFKEKIISKKTIIILLLLAIVCACFIEYYIYQDKEKSEKNLYSVINETFERLGRNTATACEYYSTNIEDLKIKSCSFPDMETGDFDMNKYWKKEFADIDSLYEITNSPWSFRCFHPCSIIYLDEDGHGCNGLREFTLSPGFIGIKKGYDTTIDPNEIHAAILMSIQMLQNNVDDCNCVHENILQNKNKYYSFVGRPDADYEYKSNKAFSDICQVEPIYFKNTFSGKFNYLHVDIGKFRVFIIMEKKIGWRPELNEGAVIKSRCIYYGLTVLPLTIAAITIWIKLRRRKKSKIVGN